MAVNCRSCASGPVLLIGALLSSTIAAPLRNTQHIPERVLAQSIREPRMEAYDLSPDGRSAAMIVASGDTVAAPEWLVLIDLDTQSVIGTAPLGQRPVEQNNSPSVSFAASGKSLLVATQRLVLFDVTMLLPMRAINEDKRMGVMPLRVLPATETNIAAVAYGLNRTSYSYLAPEALNVQVVDVSTGSLIAQWSTQQFPLSISPDGLWIAFSSSEAGSNGCFGLDLVSAYTGQLKLHVSSDSLFPIRGARRKPFGRIVAKFLTNSELVVSPDGNVDDSGEAVGHSLKIIAASDGHIIANIKPEKFGPTGDVQVSRDGTSFATISRYVPSMYLTEHKRLPRGSGPELLVYSGTSLIARSGLANLLGPRLYHSTDTAGLRMSRTGARVSIVEDYSLTILSSQ